jgi:hypothetical protein
MRAIPLLPRVQHPARPRMRRGPAPGIGQSRGFLVRKRRGDEKPAAVNDDQTRSPAAKRRRRRNSGMPAAIIMAPHIRAHWNFVNGVSVTGSSRRQRIEMNLMQANDDNQRRQPKSGRLTWPAMGGSECRRRRARSAAPRRAVPVLAAPVRDLRPFPGGFRRGEGQDAGETPAVPVQCTILLDRRQASSPPNAGRRALLKSLSYEYTYYDTSILLK